MGEPALNNYSYEDYLAIDATLKDGQRIELIGGEIYFMAGASAAHQDAGLNIAIALKQKIKESGGSCIPRVAPYDIKLFKGSSSNVVQPDVMLFCKDKEKPCAVFEVLSPSTASKDKSVKKELYESFGINEYFIVDTSLHIIDAYKLESVGYRYIKGFSTTDRLMVECINAEIDMSEIFEAEGEMFAEEADEEGVVRY